MAKMLKKDWQGRIVKLRRNIQAKGGSVFMEGTYLRVHRYFGTIKGVKAVLCPGCKRMNQWAYVSGLTENDVLLMPPNFAPPMFEAGNLIVWWQNEHSKRNVIVLRVAQRKETPDDYKYTVIDPNTEQVYRDVDPTELSWA